MQRRLMVVFGAMTVALALGACGTTGPGAAAQAGPKKVVFQVSDDNPRTWNLALNNVRNVQHDLGRDNVVAEIVVYGPGIGMLKAESKVEPRVTAALTDGVKVVACETTMQSLKLTRADMMPGIAYVPAGVVELMARQREGYSYIRP